MTPPRTPIQQAAYEAFLRACLEDDSGYPDELKIISSDQMCSPGLTPGELLDEVKATGRTIVIVAADGSEIHVTPRPRRGLMGRIAQLIGRPPYDISLEERVHDASKLRLVVHAPEPSEVQRVLAAHA